MSKAEIRTKIHNLVDTINDEIILVNFYDAFSSLSTNSKHMEPTLTDVQEQRLADSVAQYKSGNIVSDFEVKKEIASWFGK